MFDVLVEVSTRFERPMRELGDELACQHSQARFFAKSCSIGSTTEFQGHTLYLECSWPGRCTAEPDLVTLEIQLCRLTTSPRINSDVCWSSGSVVKEFATEWSSSKDWPEATPEVLDFLSARMPELFEAFRREVARGMPWE